MSAIKDAKSISIYSPNLLILKRNGVAQGPTCDVKQELLLSLKHVLADSPKFESVDGDLHVFLPKLPEDLELASEDVEITVKIFLLDPSVPPESSNINDALDTTLKWLNVKKADLLVLAFHGLLLQDDSEETQYKLDSIQISGIWKSMEKQNSDKKANELGVCEFFQDDVTKSSLERHYQTNSEPGQSF
ncbi:hypothetical protein DSO57_1020601 [Entomophthora muscae]|uniref:Uncharacterized protein n=1 Tax=Entomophthora muscae TaxID=34485 RepID=A0ACC2UQB1_9FUNG|nr:hypothetical protein DSO57_1020601 [Entomophthora muscae]